MIAVLLVIVVGFGDRHSVGLPVRIAKATPCMGGDGRIVVLHVRFHGLIRINIEDSTAGELGQRLNDIFRTRAERFVFVRVEQNVEFGDVAKIIDIASKEVDYVVIVTPLLEKQARWWGDPKNGDCIDPNLPAEYIGHSLRR